ncbi:MAG: HEAT repeat domain-containing protein [Ktedonobacteraceae bacterium]|nr:HEAT repeat domain-containing protein [Ktedonobacteraceae bacterium]MBO0792452.1 HEAT repeat domain-containing protein [Ktedonobacteraceae bacterium]
MEQIQLRQKLEDLRQGKIPPGELYATIHDFGRAYFLEARPDVERFLTHPDSQYRGLAIHVLASDWRLPECWETARKMLLTDPDVDCRMKAASALQALKRDTQDHPTLEVLAGVVTNQQEEQIVREVAYAAMRGVVKYDPREQFRFANEGLVVQEVDWNWVRSFLQAK